MPRVRRLTLGAALALALGLADACWIEPRLTLLRDSVHIGLAAPRLRVAHLSDLHIDGDRPIYRRLAREIAAARPDLIVITGDFIQDKADRERRARNTAAAAAFIAAIRRTAPVLGVQGHSEHQGDVVSALERAGVEWLSNEGRRIGPDGSILLLGLNTQVGYDRLAPSWPSPFRPMRWKGRRLYGVPFKEPAKNFYSHYDPSPAGIADTGGPLSWSGYEVTCDVLTGDEDSGAALVVHSRYVLGEDRMIRLRRVKPDHGLPGGTFYLVPHGTALTGKIDTGVEPEPGRWYRIRLRTEVDPGVVRVKAKVWPADTPEPQNWQADAEDRSPSRVQAGTVGLWTSAEGPVLYRNLRVVDRAGRVLLNDSLEIPEGRRRPRGFREDARGTRLDMALARSPSVPGGTAKVVLSHTPDVIRDASVRGLEAVIAGHTHGGQVRLPFFGALTTRSSLGPHYAMGRFEFAAPSQRGLTTLWINSGVGMSLLPVRFWCPPRWTLIELGV
ncbi:MAG TPA: metallophosphoesterase [Thermoanaerobaculia bacterium]|nr:metallophosphoesterase [Thermoanaerobaculia bacterium]